MDVQATYRVAMYCANAQIYEEALSDKELEFLSPSTIVAVLFSTAKLRISSLHWWFRNAFTKMHSYPIGVVAFYGFFREFTESKAANHETTQDKP